MTTTKSFSDLQQSKKLAEILPIESADMTLPFRHLKNDEYIPGYVVSRNYVEVYNEMLKLQAMDKEDVCQLIQPAWSLAALLNILHSKAKDIPSLSGGGYKDGNYISDWCLDYEFEDGDYQKTFADNPVDACVAMIERLHELNLL